MAKDRSRGPKKRTIQFWRRRHYRGVVKRELKLEIHLHISISPSFILINDGGVYQPKREI